MSKACTLQRGAGDQVILGRDGEEAFWCLNRKHSRKAPLCSHKNRATKVKVRASFKVTQSSQQVKHHLLLQMRQAELRAK